MNLELVVFPQHLEISFTSFQTSSQDVLFPHNLFGPLETRPSVPWFFSRPWISQTFYLLTYLLMYLLICALLNCVTVMTIGLDCCACLFVFLLPCVVHFLSLWRRKVIYCSVFDASIDRYNVYKVETRFPCSDTSSVTLKTYIKRKYSTRKLWSL